MSVYTPQPRVLKPGLALEKGDDVTVYQEVLHSLGYLQWKSVRRGLYAENTWKAVGRFQKTHGLEASNILGPRVHRMLAWHMTPGQGWRLAMANGKQQGGGGQLLAEGMLWYHQAGPYAYDQDRAFTLVMPPLVARALDCSSIVITDTYACGFQRLLKSPENHNGFGNTHSMVKEGVGVDWQKEPMHRGDFVHYNTHAPNEHMGCYIGSGQIVDHGSNGFPKIRDLHIYPIYAVRRLVTP